MQNLNCIFAQNLAMKTICFSFLLAFFCFSAKTQAQKNFSEGYIILLSGDTVYGKINDHFSAFNSIPKKIKFIGKDTEEKKYLANKLKGYSKGGIANYVSISDLDRGPFFARILIEGPLTLLTTRVEYSGGIITNNINSRGINTNNVFNSNSNTVFYFLKHVKKKSTHQVSELQFKADMSEYFSDYSELQQQISNRELRFADLEIIVTKYNQWYNNK
jgi:hypothetical protein